MERDTIMEVEEEQRIMSSIMVEDDRRNAVHTTLIAVRQY